MTSFWRSIITNSITYLMSVVRDKGCAAFYLNRRRSVEKQIESDFVIRPIKEPVGVLTGVMWREDVEKPPELVDLLRCLERVMAADRLEK